MSVQTKRIYDDAEPHDGYRVLVMTYWPRGIGKEKTDEWARELGTPADLIDEWKNGEVSWKEFKEIYLESIDGNEEKVTELAGRAASGTVTLLCGCKDEEHCHRSVLKELINERQGE